MLSEMGFPTDRASHAVALTGGTDVQLAMNWLLEHADEPLSTSSLASSIEATQQHEQVKMVIAVRRDLSMGKGKIAAQCAHAAVDLYRQLSQQDRLQQSANTLQALLLSQWEANGEPKIVVGCVCSKIARFDRHCESAIPTHSPCSCRQVKLLLQTADDTVGALGMCWISQGRQCG